MKNINYIYISNQFNETVIDSQVLNWLELYDKKDINFDLLIITPISYLISNNPLRRKKIYHAKSVIDGQVHQVFIPKVVDFFGLTKLIIFINLLILLLLKYQVNHNKVVIQTRIGSYPLVFNVIKKFFKNLRIIYDYRGAGAEEFINKQGFNNISEVRNKKTIKRYNKILNNELDMIKLSDYIFSVSNKLKEYATTNIKIINRINEKIIITPGAADQEKFFFDENVRKEMRNKLNLESKFVIIYTGKLNAYWHKRDKIFKIIANLCMLDSKLYFVCITPDISMAMQLAEKYSLNSAQYLIKSLEFREIPNYLNIADIGIILRDDIMTNRVSSPTKIPEYLLTGLPIIMSDNIGDYSDFVKKYNLGVIIDNAINTEQLYQSIKNIRINRKNINEFCRKNFSKQSVLERVLEIHHNLFL